jgi:hypothetical protein
MVTHTHTHTYTHTHTHTHQERDELLVTRGRKWIDINSKTEKEIHNAGESESLRATVPYASKWARLDLTPGNQS